MSPNPQANQQKGQPDNRSQNPSANQQKPYDQSKTSPRPKDDEEEEEAGSSCGTGAGKDAMKGGNCSSDKKQGNY